MRQKGQILPIMAISIGLLLLALGVTAKWAMHQSDKRAEAEAQARQWQATAMECSDSVEKAAKAGQEAARKAKAALAKARAVSIASKTEAARLKAELGKKATCEGAVAAVRKGLK